MTRRFPFVFAVLALAALGLGPGTRAQTATFTTLHSFTALSGIKNTDGSDPNAELILGSDGNFYGTTLYGFNGVGGIFKIAPDGTFTALFGFSFDVLAPVKSADGAHPTGSLVEGPDGNFYGTTSQDGRYGGGTVFRMTPAGVLTTLFYFGQSDSSGNIPDGADPAAGLTLGTDGNFYGTTPNINSQTGTVFKITPDGALTTIYHSGTGPGEVYNRKGQLCLGTDGNFYGVGSAGGTSGNGGVFQITPAGVETILYLFSGADGSSPVAGLIQGTDGNFYGTTTGGTGVANNGTVFRVSPTGDFTSLHFFANDAGDVGHPMGRLVQGSDGNFYGTTFTAATIFQMTPAGVVTSLYTFPDSNPRAGLIQTGDGSFYGTASDDLNFPDPPNGSVFKLSVAGLAGAATPVIKSAPSVGAEAGAAFSYQITATNSPTGYAATGLPPGLGVNAATGLISGTPTVAGTYSVGLSARNSGGAGTATLALTVAPAGSLVVNLVATIPSVTAGSGNIGEFTLSFSQAQTSDVPVNFLIKGTGVNGQDYTLLKTSKKIKAGKVSKPIKIVPQGDLGGVSKKTVVLELAPGDGYTVGTTGKVKVKILAPAN